MEHQQKDDQHVQPSRDIKRLFHRYVLIGVVLVLLVASFSLGYDRGRSNQAFIPLNVQGGTQGTKGTPVDFALFWKIWDMLHNKYVDAGQLDSQKLYYGAIKGMLAATGDPYTTFFDPDENKQFAEDITGNFEGIGAELGIKSGVLTIIAPLSGTPAEKAGLRAGDKIIKIDGKNAADMSVEQAVDKIRGPKGTTVTLTIFRDGDQDTRDISVERNTITVKSVTLSWKDNGIADIKITRFGDDTTQGFYDAIAQVKAQNARGLIIDLRNNPGGYLESAIDIASKLLPENKVVVIEEAGDKSQKKMYTRGGDMASGIPTVVLINEGSASASEILSGALKDNRANVTLIGKKSFGKGSVQEFEDLPQGTAVKITVARWLTPNGEQINQQGIAPDKEVDLTVDDYNNNKDPQLDAAIKILLEHIR